MLDERTLSVANRYWAAQFGCTVSQLFAEPIHISPHGADLADYQGVFALFRGGSAAISMPSDKVDALTPLLAPLRHECSPDAFAAALGSVSTAAIGPACIGYAATIPPPSHPTRALQAADATAHEGFRQSCSVTDWEHGGSPLERPCSAVFVSERIAALAGYELWGNTIAHLSVVAHPEFRGRGFGRNAVAHLAQRAISAGALPQYRTLESNYPSLRVAESLGFHSYARSMAIRLEPNI